MAKILRSDNLGRRTEQAKRALVRCIWDSNLKAGDKLPPQDVFCQKLGLGKATIVRALNALKVDGVLATRRRVGTYVVDPGADGHAGRMVGLAALQSNDTNLGPFYSCLLHYLQTHFSEVGWATSIFYCKPHDGPESVGLDYFPGLKRSVEENRLDAVLLTPDVSPEAWNWLEKKGKKTSFVGAATHAPVGTFIDYSWVTREAIKALLEKGCRRPGIVTAPGVIKDFVWPAFCEMVKEIKSFDPERYYFTGESLRGGQRIVRELLAFPSAERPDGLILLDDCIAQGLITELVRLRLAGESYLPEFAGMFNRQVPLVFPIDNIIRFEINLNELASIAVEMIVDQVKNAGQTPKKIWYKPKRVFKNSESI